MIRQLKRVLLGYNSFIRRERVISGHRDLPLNHKLTEASQRKYFATSRSVSEDAKKENHAARVDLAVAFRALDYLGLNEGVDNHLSVMAPAVGGHGSLMIVNPYGLDWSEITASNLVGINSAGEIIEGEGKPTDTAPAIHMGIRDVRPTKTECIMHTHMPYATSLGILKDPTLKLYHQSSAQFLGNVAYDYNYQGVADAREEGRRLGKTLGEKYVLMMGNHGPLTTADNVAMAFYWMYFLERCSMFQILALSTGKELREYPEELARSMCEKLGDQGWQGFADVHFAVMKRKMLKKYPDILN